MLVRWDATGGWFPNNAQGQYNETPQSNGLEHYAEQGMSAPADGGGVTGEYETGGGYAEYTYVMD